MSAVRVVWVLYMDVKHATATSCRRDQFGGPVCAQVGVRGVGMFVRGFTGGLVGGRTLRWPLVTQLISPTYCQ